MAKETLVAPFHESLEKFDEQVRGLEFNIKNVQRETHNLATALRNPQVRGRWGEMTLKRVVELAGMSEHCDFTEQFNVSFEGGRIRPDMVVHLPSGRQIVIDAKVSLDAYLTAISAESEALRNEALAHHARQIRNHMQALSAKSYWEQFSNAPEFVVMFIPGESFFAAAVDADHRLIEDGYEKSVILATPATLIAVIRAVAFGWRQEQLAQNAREISELGKQLHERLRTMAGHISGVGASLEKANAAYNSAVASLESRVLPAARRFKDLGAAPGEEIEMLKSI